MRACSGVVRHAGACEAMRRLKFSTLARRTPMVCSGTRQPGWAGPMPKGKTEYDEYVAACASFNSRLMLILWELCITIRC